MARITRKQRQQAASEAMAMQTDADLARAISGASDAEAAQILQGAGINSTSTTSPVVDVPAVVEEPVVPTVAQPKGVAGAEWKPTPGGGFELQVQGMPAADWNAAVAKGEVRVQEGKTVVSPAREFDKNAFTIVTDLLKQYGIEDLESVVRGWITEGVSEQAAIANLRGTKAYQKRFRGNELRRDAGLNVFDEATYLAQENDYEEWARYYGVFGKLGDTKEKRRETFANLMANSVFTPEYKDRLSTYVERVDMGDPVVKRTLRSFYGITDDDLLGYFINPKENLKILQEKVTAAEIGGAATAQGLAASRAGAEDLARFGIDRAAAIAGYRDIAQRLPRGQMLGGIYREEGIDYTQQVAEEEEFKEMESARRARRRLAERETATFGGASAIARGSLGSGTAGAI